MTQVINPTVPYIGAIKDLDLGEHDLLADVGYFGNSLYRLQCQFDYAGLGYAQIKTYGDVFDIHIGNGSSSSTVVMDDSVKINQATGDYSNASAIQIENTDSYFQSPIRWTSLGTTYGLIRCDYTSGISYAGSEHIFYVGGDYPVGVLGLKVHNNQQVEAGAGFTSYGNTGQTDSFLTGDGRTANFTGGILTGLA